MENESATVPDQILYIAAVPVNHRCDRNLVYADTLFTGMSVERRKSRTSVTLCNSTVIELTEYPNTIHVYEKFQ